VQALRYSRRAALGLGAAGALALQARPARGADLTPAMRFATAPAWNVPPLAIDRFSDETAPGYVFLAPFGSQSGLPGTAGPLVVDDAGEPVWFLPLKTESAYNMQVQTYRGRPVITWYESTGGELYGGTCVLYDAGYHEVKRVHGGHGYAIDVHEFLITSRDTALVAIANDVTYDLTPVGGSADAIVVEGIVQELDIETGKVLFEWRSLDHVSPEESFRTAVTDAGNVDYFHLNSIGVAPDGDLIVSARHTSTVYKLDRRTGAIVWRLGGKRNEFTIGEGANFEFQHDARLHADGSLTLFDNGATDLLPGDDVEVASRPLRLQLDEQAKTAELIHVYAPPTPRLATAMGNVQRLPDGSVFVGWGTAGGYTEFAPDGSVRLDARFTDGSASYRCFRFPWDGRPQDDPAVVLAHGDDGDLVVRASWNGATEVAYWQVRTGGATGPLTARGTTPRDGFETTLEAAPADRLTAVALDAKRRELGATPVVNLT
jgi:hypothetical protein